MADYPVDLLDAWIFNMSYADFEINETTAIPTAQQTVLDAKQAAAIFCIVIASLLSLLTNSLLFGGQLRLSGWNVSGFDALVLNQLLINILSTIFIDPWDIVAYSVIKTKWPFTETFCYFTRFAATCLPFMNSWNIALMALHQFIAYAFLNTPAAVKWYSFRSSRFMVILLPILIWIFGVLIHAPITYKSWGIHYDGHCATENLFALLHDSLGLFLLPSLFGFGCLVALAALKLLTKKILPHEDEGSSRNLGTVAFQVPSTEAATRTTPWTVSDDYHRFENGLYETDKENLIISPPAYEKSGTLPVADQSPRREITRENVLIALAVFVGLIIFIAPYGVFAMYLDFGLRVKEDWTYIESFWFFKFCFPWALAKPLFEPLVILCVSPHARLAFTSWIRTKTVISVPTSQSTIVA
ncbi:hypothetical protein RvY_05954 [Ramazzottius varieornatus]|uniref:G-protein coupled receptors family 1 profile domain-containing protein n=1 Tax=Ramazzottius varieornatus TaxID=947166 RepID=A0A1D1V0E0_RAMVA|nr:hypothetical protein RvY_05954 [Ramazzottius varieornatus]